MPGRITMACSRGVRREQEQLGYTMDKQVFKEALEQHPPQARNQARPLPFHSLFPIPRLPLGVRRIA